LGSSVEEKTGECTGGDVDEGKVEEALLLLLLLAMDEGVPG
jgi:hypothetical protein